MKVKTHGSYIELLKQGELLMAVTKTKKFTHRLFENVQPIWEKNHNHPFVQEIGKGTLDKDKFIYYMKQDYVYLIDYSKLFAVGCIKVTRLRNDGKIRSNTTRDVAF